MLLHVHGTSRQSYTKVLLNAIEHSFYQYNLAITGSIKKIQVSKYLLF